MPTLTIVLDFSSDDREVIDLTSGEQGEVIDLVSSDSSSEDTSTFDGSSSSFSDDDSYLPSWTCHRDGKWVQLNEIFDECDGVEKESKSTADWFDQLISRRPKKR